LVITTANGQHPVGVVSDLDVATGVAAGADCSAHEAAATKALMVSADESLRNAAQMMTEDGVSHLSAVDGAGGYPVRGLSMLDVASVYADN
jgi:CBS domain-containing protein